MPLAAPGTDIYNWYYGQCPGGCAERKSNSKAQDYSWAFGFSAVSNKAGYSELRKGGRVPQYSCGAHVILDKRFQYRFRKRYCRSVCGSDKCTTESISASKVMAIIGA